MLTFEQKAGAWDGLKEAMMDMERSLEVSSECRRMAGEFLLLMRQAEAGNLKQESNNNFNLTTASGTGIDKDNLTGSGPLQVK